MWEGVRLVVKCQVPLLQHVEYRIERGASETKSVVSLVLEHRSPAVAENSRAKFEPVDSQAIRIPVVPPTMVGVCRLVQVFYVLRVCAEDERKNESLQMEFPLTVATVPYRASQTQIYSVTYGECAGRGHPTGITSFPPRALHRLQWLPRFGALSVFATAAN